MNDLEYVLHALNEQLRAKQILIDYYRKEYEKALATIEEMNKAKEEM